MTKIFKSFANGSTGTFYICPPLDTCKLSAVAFGGNGGNAVNPAGGGGGGAGMHIKTVIKFKPFSLIKVEYGLNGLFVYYETTGSGIVESIQLLNGGSGGDSLLVGATVFGGKGGSTGSGIVGADGLSSSYPPVYSIGTVESGYIVSNTGYPGAAGASSGASKISGIAFVNENGQYNPKPILQTNGVASGVGQYMGGIGGSSPFGIGGNDTGSTRTSPGLGAGGVGGSRSGYGTSTTGQTGGDAFISLEW